LTFRQLDLTSYGRDGSNASPRWFGPRRPVSHRGEQRWPGNQRLSTPGISGWPTQCRSPAALRTGVKQIRL